jgi:hypothetical protein
MVCAVVVGDCVERPLACVDAEIDRLAGPTNGDHMKASANPEQRALHDLIKAFGARRAPSRITQEPLDCDPGHYKRLCDRDTPASPSDLCRYADDLSCMAVQAELLVFLLPTCLSAWQQSLMPGTASRYATFVERFSGALAKHAGFRDLLSPRQYAAAGDFVREAILARIDHESRLQFGRTSEATYAWVCSMASMGTAFPVIGDLWSEWWACRTQGRARGVLQYLSLLMYPEDRNPIFAPWTPQEGGGPPIPWETDGFIYEQSWLPENVESLRSILTVDYARYSLCTAAAALQDADDSGIPARLLGDFDQAAARVELRIEELVLRVSRPLGEDYDWTTDGADSSDCGASTAATDGSSSEHHPP